MSMMTEAEAKRICDKVLSLAKADQCEVQLTGGRTGNIRFARNTVSTSGLVDDIQLVVAVAYGKRQGTVTTNELDDAGLERAVRRAEELAKLAPENPEFMPAIGKQRLPLSNVLKRLPTVWSRHAKVVWSLPAFCRTTPALSPRPTRTVCSVTRSNRALISLAPSARKTVAVRAGCQRTSMTSAR